MHIELTNMGDINEFFDNLMIRIRARCEKSGNSQGCELWTGGKTGGYGRMRVRYPDGTCRIEYVSRLIYKCQIRSTCTPHADDKGNPLDVSHLCHNSLCVVAHHLVLETHDINMERVHCNNQQLCTGNHMPNCIL